MSPAATWLCIGVAAGCWGRKRSVGRASNTGLVFMGFSTLGPFTVGGTSHPASTSLRVRFGSAGSAAWVQESPFVAASQDTAAGAFTVAGWAGAFDFEDGVVVSAPATGTTTLRFDVDATGQTRAAKFPNAHGLFPKALPLDSAGRTVVAGTPSESADLGYGAKPGTMWMASFSPL
jgi:hypothetical protein